MFTKRARVVDTLPTPRNRRVHFSQAIRFRQISKKIGAREMTRVARWFVFKPKIQIWVSFGGSCNGRYWYILWTLGPFYSLLLYLMDIWYSSW
jgi:hypothetical protein